MRGEGVYRFAYSQIITGEELRGRIEKHREIYINTITDYMKQMRKTILLILTIAFSCVATGATLAAQEKVAAQKKTKPKLSETRDITIYVYEISAESTDFPRERLVPVRRTIANNKPLSRALKLLLEGVNEEEQNRNLFGIASDLKFVSARIKNRTAQINLKFENEEIVEESWEGSGFKNEDFVKAVELTARQFPGIERVSICVNGIENYADFGSEPIKCSFEMFATQH